MTITLTLLVYFGAAVWRLSNLIANEKGPFGMFETLRSKTIRAEVRSRRKNGFLYRFHATELLNCEYCNSIWFGGFFTLAYLISPNVATILAFPLALSTVAIFFKKVHFVLAGLDTRLDQQNQEYLREREHYTLPIKKVEALKQPIRKEVEA